LRLGVGTLTFIHLTLNVLYYLKEVGFGNLELGTCIKRLYIALHTLDGFPQYANGQDKIFHNCHFQNYRN